MKVTLTKPTAKVPTKAHPDDAGWDLYIPKEITLVEGEVKKVDLGIKIAIPSGHVGLIFPRSSMSDRRISLANTVGVVDSNYRGPLKLALIYNPTIDMPLTETVEQHERLAQLVILPVAYSLLQVVDSLDETDRGEGGFGSSGK